MSWEDVLATKEKHFKYVTIIRSEPLLERICSDQIEKHDSSTFFSFGVAGVIVTFVLLIVCIRIECSRRSKLRKYIAEQRQNAELDSERLDWLVKCDEAKSRWRILLEEYQKKAEDKRAELELKIEELSKEKSKWEEKIADLEKKAEIYDNSLREKIVTASRDIPEELKFGWFDYETIDYSSIDLSTLLDFIETDNIKDALMAYHRCCKREQDKLMKGIDEHKEDKRQYEEKEYQRECIRIEKERNELEKEKIRAYERQEAENRRQQQRLAEQAQKDAEKERRAAEARIRCMQCNSYSTCISFNKNKNPHCVSFRVKKN